MTRAHNFIDLSGQVFGRLTVLRIDPECKPKVLKYICRCECGNEKSIYASNLRKGDSTSCGRGVCRVRWKLDGEKKGFLSYVRESHFDGTCRMIVVRCACGTEKVLSANAFMFGNIISCGCYSSKRKAEIGVLRGELHRSNRDTLILDSMRKGSSSFDELKIATGVKDYALRRDLRRMIREGKIETFSWPYKYRPTRNYHEQT